MLTTSNPSDENSARFLGQSIRFFTLILVIACLSWGQAVLVPLALALFFSFLLNPLVNRLEALRLNRAFVVGLVVVITGAVCVSIAWIVTTQVRNLAYDLRHKQEYRQHIKEKLSDLRVASKRGTLADLQATINEVSEGATKDPTARSTDPSPTVTVREETSSLQMLGTTIQPLVEPLGAAALVVVLVIFMLLKPEDLRNRLIALLGSKQLMITTKALQEASHRISRYLLMQFIVNASYGGAIALGLFFLGIPYALLWGFLAGVLRYIPYVGPWVAAFFPIAISLVAFSGWVHAIEVISLVIVLELLNNMVMEPWLYGQSAGVSEVGLLVVTAFWTWLWGPIGLILATPLTVCLIVLGRHVPQLHFFDMLLGAQPALDPYMIYYQRLLARDQEEAADLVEQYTHEHPQDAVYDEVLIPALLLALQDRKTGILDGEGETFVLQATQEIVAELDVETPQEAANDKDRPLSPLLILGCPARHEAEEVIIYMLAKLLQASGTIVEVMSTRTHADEIATYIRQHPPLVVYIATLPGGLPQTRYLCKSLRDEFPLLPIVVGYWGVNNDFDALLVRLRQAGATHLVTSLRQSRSRILTCLEETEHQPLSTEMSLAVGKR